MYLENQFLQLNSLLLEDVGLTQSQSSEVAESSHKPTISSFYLDKNDYSKVLNFLAVKSRFIENGTQVSSRLSTSELDPAYAALRGALSTALNGFCGGAEGSSELRLLFQNSRPLRQRGQYGFFQVNKFFSRLLKSSDNQLICKGHIGSVYFEQSENQLEVRMTRQSAMGIYSIFCKE